MSVDAAHATGMIHFDELLRTAPDVAEPILLRLRETGIGLLGTLRADGSPRVSPIEVAVVDDRLWLGMMPGSRKQVDVLRDPRVALLTPVRDREDVGGEGKLFGRLEPVTDRALADRLLASAAEAAGFDPDAVAGSPMFELVVDAAAWQHVAGDEWRTLSWREGNRLRRRRRVGATGASEDVDEFGPVGAPA